jgi:hypothetical protein
LRHDVFDGNAIVFPLRDAKMTTFYAIRKIDDLSLLGDITLNSVDCEHD